MLDELLPAAQHVTVPYATTGSRPTTVGSRPGCGPCAGMRGLKRDHSLRIVATGHAFVQNLRRGHYELATEASVLDRVAVAFTEPALGV